MRRLIYLFCFSSTLLANPKNPSIICGEVVMQEGVASLDIHASDKSIIHWDSFSIDLGEITRFHQESANAAVLNRVIGSEISELMGILQAEGRVYLLNPNGILIGKEGVIQTNGFVASTLDIQDKDFLMGEKLLVEGESIGVIRNLGTIQSSKGPLVLLSHGIENAGVLKGGEVSLGSGHRFYLQKEGQTEMLISPDLEGEGISNEGVIRGLEVQLQSDGTASLAINQEGVCQASRIENEGGRIYLKSSGAIHLGKESQTKAEGLITLNGKEIYHFGKVESSHEKEGKIRVEGEYLYQDGEFLASGDENHIFIHTDRGYTGTESSKIVTKNGGEISLHGTTHLFTSGMINASGENGGTIEIGADNLSLYAARIKANGERGAGEIYIGGTKRGEKSFTETLHVNHATEIEANGALLDTKGTIVLWSDLLTDFRGNISAKDGFVEISGKELRNIGNVEAGELLLDPETVLISSSLGSYPSYQFVDPDAGNGSGFGTDIIVLSSGNVAVSKPSGGTANQGAVYLFNGSTGALINGVVGTLAGDAVGSGGLTAVGSNANYVISSPAWSTNFGAATFVNGSSGLSSSISSSNSLVGSNSGDLISNDGITLLSNGNYVVVSSTWNSNAGAVTFGNGSTGISGVASSTNSLVGAAGDFVGSGGVTALTNGNYVIASPSWDSVNLYGAATWGDGSLGTTGVVSFGNSIVGGTANDQVSSGGITALTNGNYVISSPLFDDIASDVGAATWANGSFATMAVVTSANSIIGSTASDQVSSGGITALSNGNYVIASPVWDNAAITDAGAATWADGTTSTSDVVGIVNSIVGSSASDGVASGGITALQGNGNYVVLSPSWNGNMGAATWADGSAAAMITVGGANSLIGSIAGDQVSSGGVTALTNGNFVVSSPVVDIGANNMAGAATWGDGTSGVTGAVAAGNSLVGSAANEMVSSSGVTALTNGNFVVSSPFWNANAGAATFGDGSAGITGAINAGNSLIGGAGDTVAFDGAVALTNGNYVVISSQWTGGTGAVTLGDGTLGVVGMVNATNSLVGSGGADEIGSGGVTAFSSGGYAISSPDFDGAGANSGAATFADSSGIVGTVGVGNSVLGLSAGSGLSTIVEDSINGTFICPFLTESTGIVRAGYTQADFISASSGSGQAIAISPGFIEAQLLNGTSLTIEASQDITFFDNITVSSSAPFGTSFTVNAGNDLFLNADITGEDVSLNFTAGQNLFLDNNALIETNNGNILLIAGTDIVGLTPVTLQTTGATSTLTLVADNAFANPPDVGTGIINLTSDSVVCTNSCIGGGNLQLYTSTISGNSFPDMMNMTSVPGSLETFGVYFPDGTEGFPFQIFYKAGLLDNFTGVVEVFSATVNETFPDTVDQEEETGQGTVRNPDGISTTNPAPCS